VLTKLRLNNFTSFKEETTFDFRATHYKILEKTNVFEGTLKGAMFVGANASGKTNVFRSLRMLLQLLFKEEEISLRQRRCLFSDNPKFKLGFEFAIGSSVIDYAFEYDARSGRFTSETLTLDGEEVLRRIGGNARSRITDRELIEDIPDESLILREIYFNTKFRNQKPLQLWFQFLLNSITLDGYRRKIFVPGKQSMTLQGYLRNGGADAINRFFEKYHFDQRIEYTESIAGTNAVFQSENKNIYFRRQGVGEPIPFQLESLGNRNLLYFLPPFFHVIRNGGMLIVDEFSSGMHNFLEELLVRYFMKESRNAQLFLVSHSTNLLSNSILRPDQLYAIDFAGADGSHIKRFSSEKPREAQNLEKMYTSGVFGGVPSYRDENDPFE